jgi:thioesterase domain-containing protein
VNTSDSSSLTETELEDYLHNHIPLTKHMELTVDRSRSDSVILRAPLEPNVNHRETVFGGSAAALAMLTGWGLVYINVNDWIDSKRIVIQHNEMAFEEPIKGTFTASCESPPDAEWNEVRSNLNRWDKARIHLDVTLTVEGDRVGKFNGAYVIVVS